MSRYWDERAAQREMEAQLIASKYLSQYQNRLREAQLEIIREIEAFYGRYAVENKVTMKEARKILNSKELEEFKSVNLEKFRALSLTGNPEYNLLLNAISYRVRISRLEALEAKIRMTMIELYGGTNGLQDITYSGLAEVYHDSYFKHMYDFYQAGVFAGSVARLDDDTMKTILSYNWSGKEFSPRIWGHQSEALQKIQNELEKSFTAGRSLKRTSRALANVADVSYSRAEALVRTEANFFHGYAAHNSYQDAGVDKYEILATLDFRTSDRCREEDGEIYDVSNYQPGKTAPPFHVRCRSTTVAYFDEDEYMDGEQRQSKDGLVDTVTFKDWYNQYVA
ncbi:minor capsid protein [Mesobacillus stamsii]|uniref:SPP1 gp7 family putative phage head morphogenesis protein n=1 Tax=Mesobacillus stamsii TaxID=225347 RepID=A0ABU0FS14_9BACI|nr:minor capsid protein [Mesobacillus stamsii]MDQ0412714.1 SPP1 gp7 family putative phage head morphogenesis protein [Mesobacillus stamsii]